MRSAIPAAILLNCVFSFAGARDPASASRGSSFLERSSRAAVFAASVLDRYDTDKDGVLKKDEWGLPQFLNEQSDRDQDGAITKEEIAQRFLVVSNNPSSTRSRSASTAEPFAQLEGRPAESASRSGPSKPVPAQAAESRPQPTAPANLPPIEGPVERLLIFARHAPALDLANVLNQHFQGSAEPGARIVAVPTSNSLLVTATPELLPQVTALVEQLDRSPAMIGLEVLVVERSHREPAAVAGAPSRQSAEQAADEELTTGPADEVLAKIQQWEAQGKLSVLHRLHMATLENQRAMVQIGQRKPVVENVQLSSRGESRNVSQQNVGMILSATARAGGDGAAIVEFQFEKSDVENHPNDPPLATTSAGEKVPSTRIVTSTAKSTLQIPRGEAVVLADVRTTGSGEKTRLLLVVSASVSGAAGKNRD